MTTLKKVLDRLEDLSKSHTECAEAMESGELKYSNGKMFERHHIEQQKFMAHCCYMAWFILKDDIELNQSPPSQSPKGE